MGNVTQKDIDFMNNISNIVEGNFNSGLSAPSPTRQHNGQRPNNVGFTPDSSGMYMDNMKKYMQIVNESLGEETKTSSPSANRSYNNAQSNYEVVIEVDNGTRIYKVKNESREVFSNKVFLVCEAALAIAHLLNGSFDEFTVNYIDNFKSLDEEFKSYKDKALYEKNNYVRAKTLNENKAASVFEDNFKNYHSKANATFEQIKSLYNLVTK